MDQDENKNNDIDIENELIYIIKGVIPASDALKKLDLEEELQKKISWKESTYKISEFREFINRYPPFERMYKDIRGRIAHYTDPQRHEKFLEFCRKHACPQG